MEVFEIKNRKASNYYFNLALERVLDNDLSTASFYLKKALLYNKNNINARNLLGLIFFRVGEIVFAAREWIVSTNIQRQNNLAESLLNDINEDRPKYNELSDGIKQYNFAIDSIEEDRYDLALMYLYKAVELNPTFTKALNLIGLLLLMRDDKIKAGSYLLKAQKIDKGNLLTNKLMDYTLATTGKKEMRDKQLGKVYSSAKIEQDDAILPNKYIDLSTNQKIAFVAIGIALGLLGYQTIVTPMMRQQISNSSTKEVVKFADLVNDQNKIIRDITIENKKLKEDYDSASIKLRAYEEQNRLFTSQYETLNEINRLFDSGYISQAAKEYINLDKENITDATLISLLNSARSKIEGLGAKRLTELGTESWNGGNRTQAVTYYQLSLSINPDDPETMFLLARLYQSMSRTSEANTLFDKIIAEHPQSNYARRSREARGY